MDTYVELYATPLASSQDGPPDSRDTRPNNIELLGYTTAPS
jgi:hypothetical protein